MCVSPARDSVEESINTLEFASRAMMVETHAVVNEMVLDVDATKLAQDLKGEGLNDAMREKIAEIRKLQELVAELKGRLMGQERKAEDSAKQARGQRGGDWDDAWRAAACGFCVRPAPRRKVCCLNSCPVRPSVCVCAALF